MASTAGNVFITGAAAGIGAATVALLAERGYTVFAGVHHDHGSLASIKGVHLISIDVTDPDSVAGAAKQVADLVGGSGVQAVINNAGVIVQGPLEFVPPAELRRQFEVNLFGVAYVVAAFLPLLRSGRGRVVNLSAPTARVPVPFLAPLCASKAALAALSDSLRGELSMWNIPVVDVVPGGTATEIFAKAETASNAALAHLAPVQSALYQRQLAAIAQAFAAQKPGPVGQVAATVVTAVAASRPKRQYKVGPGTRLFGMLSHLPGTLRDRLVSNAFGLSKIRPAASAGS